MPYLWVAQLNRTLSIIALWVVALIVYYYKKRESIFQQGEARLSNVIKYAVDGLITIDRDGIIKMFNPACEQIFGYAASEVIGHNVKMLMPEPYHGEHDGYLKNYHSTGEKKIIGIGREVQGRRRDGSVFSLDLAVSEVTLSGEKFYSGIVRDVSERRRSEQELQDSSNRLQAVMDTVIDGVITINDRGIVQSFNPSAERIFGYHEDEVKGRNVKMLMPEPYHGEHDGYMHNYLETGEAKVIGIGREVEAKRKDGSVFPMELGISEMQLGNKRMFAGTIRDITERKESEVEREQLIDKLSESNQELERFAYVASHDLQEPLRMVRNFTQLLEQRYGEKLDEDAKKYIEISSSSAERMQNLVDDLLEYARIGEEAETYEEVDCESTLKYVEENLNEQIKETGASITHEPLPTVRSNPIRLSRVLQNLVGNGLKYHQKDVPPEIHVSVEEQKTQWKFCVKDNGIGMKPEYCKQIFLPFKRLHNKNEYSGTGIGLAICRKIIENLGGRIWAESKLGKGARFYFTIPKRSRKLLTQPKEKAA